MVTPPDAAAAPSADDGATAPAGTDEDDTRLVARSGGGEDPTRVVPRDPNTETRFVAGPDGTAEATDDDATELSARRKDTERTVPIRRRRARRTVIDKTGPPDARAPEVASGLTSRYGVRAVSTDTTDATPAASASAGAPSAQSLGTPASAEEIRLAAARRAHRRSMRVMLTMVATTLVVAGLAIVGIAAILSL